jgi:pSer/pThr/pTyr-binding forkhead associated (FHA) protein
MWKLVIEDDEGKRTVVPLTRDDYTIGRKEGNSIRLTERNVSREHAKLQKRNGAEANGNGAPEVAYVLQDLTSYNGVYINGLRVAETHELAHGDLIQIGDYRIILQDDVVTEGDAALTYDSEDLKATMPQVAGLESLLAQPNRLIMLAGPTPGAEYPLTAERATIGRAEDATISVNHNSVSRLHCEVHALGEGRFEIVDKGSSNGVRLNGADLRRGIIEAGDIIELGDVKFKFVGQGQIFRPGATESQQIAAIGNRLASELAASGTGRRRRSGSLVPYVVLGAAVGVAVAGWFYFHTASKPEPVGNGGVTETAPVSSDVATVLEAKRVCDQGGDCEGAHQRISQLPEGSSARTAQEFRDVEFKWATMILLRADVEQDLVKKKALLERVAQTVTVDQQVRDSATDRLERLQPGAVPVAPRIDAGRPGVAPTIVQTAPAPPPPRTAPPPGPPQPPVPRPPATPKQNPFDLALSENPADKQKARDMLETKVYNKHGSQAEIRLLLSLCREQGDKTCIEVCKGMTIPVP